MNALNVRSILFPMYPNTAFGSLWLKYLTNLLRNTGALYDGWLTFLITCAMTQKDIRIVGNMHIRLDVADDRDAQRFISALQSCDLQQDVHEPTRIHGHTLDVVITRDTNNLVSDTDGSEPDLCDHIARLT